MTTECGFCKGTGREPGHIDCVWCDNTGRDGGISNNPAPIDEAKERELFEAWASSHGISTVRCTQGLMFANGSRRAQGDYIAVESLCSWESWLACAKSRATV